MKCPHCNKEIVSLKNLFKDDILREIKEETHTIASLSKKLEIPRSTLNHHLDKLEMEGKIKREPLKNIAGKPVIFKPMRAENE